MNIEQLREMMREGVVVKEATAKEATAKRLAGAIWDKIPEAEKAEARAEVKAEAKAEAKVELPIATLEHPKVIEASKLEYKDDKSDKVYIVQLLEGTDLTTRETFYTVEASWGRRGKSFQSQVKCTSKERRIAYTEYVNLISSKVRKGYRKVS
jgi:predicted DNA-binding WGR domain protein